MRAGGDAHDRIREVDESLRRLQTDVIDLYQIRRWYTEAPLEETARALDADQALDVADEFVAHAATVGRTPAQLALAWVQGDARITSPIVGARNVDQLKDSL
ncbi:MAG: aldo/keto reductase, partial [Spirochaetota bacterium]